MAKRGWVAARREDEQRWLRLLVFDDGWVEVPGFGRAFSGFRADARTALRTLLLGVVGIAAAVGCFLLAGDRDGVPAGALRVVGWLLFIGAFVLLAVRMFRLRSRQRARWRADGEDLRQLKAAGGLPRIRPGAPRWRRARTAEQFASWLTETTLVRAADVSVVTVLPEQPGEQPGPEQGVEVRLHAGAALRYRSPDPELGRLLTGFGATAG